MYPFVLGQECRALVNGGGAHAAAMVSGETHFGVPARPTSDLLNVLLPVRARSNMNITEVMKQAPGATVLLWG